ncbi:MAG: GNAT family N-acetyltransferase [Anaerolineae bacterium]|nr:GNAT family N-acetyltransferase [Anaerolineae bacterium]
MAFTYFFRDQQTLDLIVQHVIPTLKQHTYINIWDAGCAMGPEAYSLAMMLRENMGPFLFRNVRIYATDIDESGEFGETIARGVYAQRGVQRIPPALLEKYFTQVAGDTGDPHYQISAEMRKAVHYQRHDLLSLRPIRDGLGLIVCKNVLLHFTPEAREAVLHMFHAALAADGYLVVEQTQKLPDALSGHFEPVTGAGQVFRRMQNAECRSSEPANLWANESANQRIGESANSEWGMAKSRFPFPVSPSVSPIQHPTSKITITPDAAFTKVSQYLWINLDLEGRRLGKARVDVNGDCLTIYSLVVYPEFQNQGYARQAVNAFQAAYRAIVADCVRPEARDFWQKLGFIADQSGNYVWYSA